MYFAALPFECQHRHAITKLYVETPEDVTLPPLILSPQIRRIEAEAVSVMSAGAAQEDIIRRDMERIREAH